MTNPQAIRILKLLLLNAVSNLNYDEVDAVQLGIEALKELNAYKELSQQ